MVYFNDAPCQFQVTLFDYFKHSSKINVKKKLKEGPLPPADALIAKCE
ncbi:hypothetical protein COXBURSA334_0376 [Coxiella burnetii Q321]|uniref:Uncharacterized protein n=1 Tax=Coxiella burnetii (strain Dugway 5J108-111) TaxID=434922 RepID=A9KF64_COXBN|nr:hypothetical protein CBUD_0445 [Coxiella burnetii Dugway 5J108-111]EDR35696.1 hypothetical protein COXBURSA334_0376 [Coxiella burnetii Q321]